MTLSNQTCADRYVSGIYKSGSSKHMFFAGDMINSWGHHFKIAERRKIGNKEFYIFNKDGYSSSTARHKSCVYWAIKQKSSLFSKPNPIILKIRDANLSQYQSQIFDNAAEMDRLKEKLKRARTRQDMYKRQIKELKEETRLLQRWGRILMCYNTGLTPEDALKKGEINAATFVMIKRTMAQC